MIQNGPPPTSTPSVIPVGPKGVRTTEISCRSRTGIAAPKQMRQVGSEHIVTIDDPSLGSSAEFTHLVSTTTPGSHDENETATRFVP